MSDQQLYEAMLTYTRAEDVGRLLESHYEKMPVGVLSVGLHTLARTAASQTAAYRKAIGEMPWFGKMLMRLGGQLSGGSETDVKGLTSILWAMSYLEQAESPLLLGLVKRLFTLAQHGRVTPAQLLLAAQALARLKMLKNQIGQMMMALVQQRFGDFNAAHLGTLARALVEGLGAQAEPLLRAICTARLDEFGLDGSTRRARCVCRQPPDSFVAALG